MTEQQTEETQPNLLATLIKGASLGQLAHDYGKLEVQIPGQNTQFRITDLLHLFIALNLVTRTSRPIRRKAKETIETVFLLNSEPLKEAFLPTNNGDRAND